MENQSALDKLLANKYVWTIAFSILIANVVVVDLLFFSSKKNTVQCSQNCPVQISQITPSPLPSQSPSLSPSIPVDARQTVIPTPTPSAVPIPTATPSLTPTPGVREYFIPLGQGSGNYADWTVVPGIGVKINTANYGEIVKAYFEITIRVPTGSQTVYVRLYNANNFQSVPNSDLTREGGESILLTSQPITLFGGENLYQVQLKTQLQSLTYIDQARIRIVSR